MAKGDLTLTEHGTYDISGAALKTAVDSINLPFDTVASVVSGQIFLLPTGNGQQISVITVVRE